MKEEDVSKKGCVYVSPFRSTSRDSHVADSCVSRAPHSQAHHCFGPFVIQLSFNYFPFFFSKLMQVRDYINTFTNCNWFELSPVLETIARARGMSQNRDQQRAVGQQGGELQSNYGALPVLPDFYSSPQASGHLHKPV